MKKQDDFDLIPFSKVKAVALNHPQVNEAYSDLQIRQAMMTELKTARQQCNLTQEEVAQRAGLKKQNISRMEKGIISPNLTTLSRYAAALGGTFVFKFNQESQSTSKG
ncbi:helix-turn-helix transcriptional regulator [Yersinia massiliensis]|jgi:DNA-binding XRE family transcriptional regulator|uniref:DNA-binding phage-like protein n=2 Tax=Yersinia TaxID=629 RepID=A0AAI8ZMK8_YERFR|nr:MULTISPECIES: helix-turn-helix transcriptional regulator [Yersinia]HEC1650743.1 helix-turn-helix transcriptional regulator [Yersinia enterocolitica]ATM85829.1 XRE family transcriptional regulator [Yersinia frederiksenii]MCB5316546.1 helix-turn-helix transcriptional regulator [Yersinia massiliensis]MDA5547810.1 helix-turn-helix transcriptional regulator [Yersinia massiliensis]MDN0126825.1 helix-turn-helix transcriptional regulator [Yersinia massiliensis]